MEIYDLFAPGLSTAYALRDQFCNATANATDECMAAQAAATAMMGISIRNMTLIGAGVVGGGILLAVFLKRKK